jgi:DNA-binding XRE family transcriptional regulator
VLVPGASPNARPRVPGPASRHEQGRADAARALSASLARHRRAADLTQPQLAALADTSVTTIGDAETGRLWQSRDFWERADKVLNAAGELIALHDVYRASTATPPARANPDDATADPAVVLAHSAVEAETVAMPSGPVACITITWEDGAVTTVYPPQSVSR